MNARLKRSIQLGALVQSKFPFNVDHGPNLGVRNGQYMKLTLPAGDHVISHDHCPTLWLMGQDPQTVRVEIGKTVYFQYVSAMSIIFEVADDQARAAHSVWIPSFFTGGAPTSRRIVWPAFHFASA